MSFRKAHVLMPDGRYRHELLGRLKVGDKFKICRTYHEFPGDDPMETLVKNLHQQYVQYKGSKLFELSGIRLDEGYHTELNIGSMAAPMWIDPCFFQGDNWNTEALRETPRPKCECGGDRTNTTHSTWCPTFKWRGYTK